MRSTSTTGVTFGNGRTWRRYGISPRAYEGLVIEVNTTTNCERVALFHNGNEMGVRRTADYPNHTITWCLPYRRGTLVAKGINGTDTVAVHEIRTAGDAVRLKAIADRGKLMADGQDLSYVAGGVATKTEHSCSMQTAG